ncbi:hypothetical protein FDECE_12658 [Fusarium decemcellulare]|nr:hypothetical protein FDECE_12658 [Fusarium decemcellulare]
MHFTTIFTAAVATLASTASAAPKKIQNFANASVFAFNSNQEGYKSFEIPLGKLTHFDASITSLELRGIFYNVPDNDAPDPNAITCQRYKDQYGAHPGSAAFTKKKPAHIATNPVPFGWVLCYVNPTAV